MPLSRVPSSFTGTTRLASPAANTVAITTSSAERMRIASDGRVSINSTTHSQVLGYEHLGVLGSGGFKTTESNALGIWNTANPGLIQFYTEGGGTNAGSISATGGAMGITSGTSLSLNAPGSNIMAFQTNSLERMRITSAGRVCIGTSESNNRLNVYDSVAATVSETTFWNATHAGINMRNVSDTVNTPCGIIMSGGSSGLSISAIANITESLSLGALAFYTGGSGRSNAVPERMRIESDGDVNIGSATQNGTQSRLYVKQSADSAFRGVGVVSNAAGEFIGSFSMLSSGILDIAQSYLAGGGTYQPISFTTSGSERMRITSGGSLCVNNTTSAGGQPLYVKAFSGTGSAGFQVFANGNGAIDWYNGSAGYVASVIVNASSVAYNTTSDYRLKENIAPMTGALAKVSALKPVTYDWKSGGSSQGFIAHELQEVVPDCVTGEKDAVDADGKPKYQGVDTSFLVATLTAAIQEQQAIIASLTSRIEALENQ
jgi:hypothetical protein